jgi:hypothetical protein
MCLSHLIYRVRPCLIHTCHAIPMPRPCHALTMPFFSRPRHSTTVERRPVGYMCSASSGYHAEFHEDCYQKHTNPPHNGPYIRLLRVLLAHYKKDNLLNCWTSSSDTFGYHTDFYEGHGTVGAEHDMCELTPRHGRGKAGARHGHGMLCVNRP